LNYLWVGVVYGPLVVMISEFMTLDWYAYKAVGCGKFPSSK